MLRRPPRMPRPPARSTPSPGGISVERIAAQTLHRPIDVLIERYIRPVQALQTTSGRDLGL